VILDNEVQTILTYVFNQRAAAFSFYYQWNVKI